MVELRRERCVDEAGRCTHNAMLYLGEQVGRAR